MAFSSPPAQGRSVPPGAGVFLSSKTFPHHQYRCFKYLFRATPADILSDISDNILECCYFSSLCLSSMWHIFWRSIRPMFWRIFWHSIILSDKYSGVLFGMYLWLLYYDIQVYLTHVKTFYLKNILALCSAAYLAYILTSYLAHVLAFYLAYTLANLLTFYLT